MHYKKLKNKTFRTEKSSVKAYKYVVVIPLSRGIHFPNLWDNLTKEPIRGPKSTLILLNGF